MQTFVARADRNQDGFFAAGQLHITNLTVDNTNDGVIGRNVRMTNVNLIGGQVTGDTVLFDSGTIDGVLSIDASGFEVQGTLHQNAGGTIAVTAAWFFPNENQSGISMTILTAPSSRLRWIS
jgi:hypothetical protein